MDVASPGPEVRVVASREKFQAWVSSGNHRFMTDEPVVLGGTDKGPDPFILLLSGLGACTSSTLRMYADRKNYPLEGIEVVLNLNWDEKSIIATISRTIKLAGPLTPEQKSRLLVIAEKCPVHKMLTGEIHIDTRLSG